MYKRQGESIAKNAIEYYGSVENYAAAMKKNMENFSDNMEKIENLKGSDYMEKNDRYMKELVFDRSRDIKNQEVQNTIQKLVELTQNDDFPQVQTKETWHYMIQQYLTNDNIIKLTDEKYGNGASQYIGCLLYTSYMIFNSQKEQILIVMRRRSKKQIPLC